MHKIHVLFFHQQSPLNDCLHLDPHPHLNPHLGLDFCLDLLGVTNTMQTEISRHVRYVTRSLSHVPSPWTSVRLLLEMKTFDIGAFNVRWMVVEFGCWITSFMTCLLSIDGDLNRWHLETISHCYSPVEVFPTLLQQLLKPSFNRSFQDGRINFSFFNWCR